MRRSDPITEYDLQAYVDGLLPDARCRQVEQHLANQPETAAQIMADMANARIVRDLAEEPLQAPPPALIAAAARLDQALARRPAAWRGWTIAAAAACCVLAAGAGAGVAIQLNRAATPDFVEDALMSRKTAFLRAGMDSQPEAQRLDRREISRATQIVLPNLPANWRLTDVQIFPSDDGPSVGIVFNTPELGAASLFAVRDPGEGEIEPTTIERDGGVVTYWRSGDMAYALIARAGLDQVSDTARRLASGEPGREVRL